MFGDSKRATFPKLKKIAELVSSSEWQNEGIAKLVQMTVLCN